ncbi:MAG: prepilin-type N-terminal cleavage/methylation domain-containing protein [Gemmatimonadales bacterium]|nr:MAG: prepilin-type N-terminal cleavage/methylation domain-containing protein [Gemmatimonadales bacterium]
MMSRNSNSRGGFSLVELIVVIVIAGLVATAIFQILVSNQRIYTAQGESVRGQQTVRGAVEFLATELREISPRGGDILTMESDEIEVRAMRASALVCGRDGSDIFATALAGRIRPGDEVLVYFQEDPDTGNSDFWTTAEVTSESGSEQPQRCGDDPTRRYTLDNFADDSPTAIVDSGSLIRTWETVTYGLITQGGESFVGRIDSDGEEALIGPVEARRGLEFAYLDRNGDVTTDALEVRSIRITVRTLSQARDSGGRAIADSLSVLVTPRN